MADLKKILSVLFFGIVLCFNLRSEVLPFDNKAIIIKLVYIVLLAFFSFILYLNTGLSRFCSKRNILVILPILCCFFLEILSNNNQYYFSGVVEACGGTVAFFSLLYIFVSGYLNIHRHCVLLFFLSLSVTLVVGFGKLFGFWDYFILFNPNHLHFLMLFSFWLIPLRLIYRLFGFVSLLVSALVFGSTLTAVALLLALLFLISGPFRKIGFHLVVWAVILLLLFLLYSPVIFTDSAVLELLSGRFGTWYVYLSDFEDSRLIDYLCGLGSVDHSFFAYKGHAIKNPHNFWISQLYEIGFIGLILTGIMFSVIIQYADESLLILLFLVYVFSMGYVVDLNAVTIYSIAFIYVISRVLSSVDVGESLTLEC